jgi:hypothetical protein
MATLPETLRQTTGDGDIANGDRCPWCDQPISHQKFEEIRGRIEAQERQRSAEVEGRLKREVAQAKTEAQAKIKAEVDAARTDAAAAIEAAKRDAAAKVLTATAEARKAAQTELAPKLAEVEKAKADAERIKRESAASVKAATEEAEREAQKALAPKLAAAESAKKTAEQQLQVLRANQQAALNQKLQEQRGVLEKANTDAVNAERAKNFNEKQKLEGKLQQLQRQLQGKTADELGEGAEIDLLEVLKGEFPEDDIRRVGKGKEGADILHKVVDKGRDCGSIIYDSKNRSAWRNDYVTKLRGDQLAAKADHAVLATQVFPAGARQLHLQDGVIILNPARTIVVAAVLRNHIMQTHTLRLSREARTDKTARLYDFITSERCAQLLEQIETETDDMLDLDVKEKKLHDATWKRRGQLIRSVQRVHVEFTSELDRIVGGPTVVRAAAET